MDKLLNILVIAISVAIVGFVEYNHQTRPLARSVDDIPLCSSGQKVELDVEYFKQYHYDEYVKLPKTVRVLGFRPMLCK